MANSSTKNTRAAGTSTHATSTGELKNSRTVRRSFKGCAVPPGARLRLALKMIPKTRFVRRWSSFREASCINWLRAHSSTSITMKMPITTSVSIHKVKWLRLLTTRSYTSSMYTEGASTNRLAIMPIQAARLKSGVSSSSAARSSERGLLGFIGPPRPSHILGFLIYRVLKARDLARSRPPRPRRRPCPHQEC